MASKRDDKSWSPEEMREAERLHEEERLTWKEVGERFGVSRHAARQAVKRYRKKREELGVEREGRVSQLKRQAIFPDWKLPEDVDWRELLESFDDSLELYKRVDPTQEILTVDLAHLDEPIAVAFAADLHLGGGFTNHREIQQSIEYILNTDGLYLAIVGDTIEGFIPGLKSAETSEQMAGPLKLQLAALKSLVDDLGKHSKILCMTWGDHDAKWFEQLVGFNAVKSRMHDKVPYFTGRGLIRLRVGEEEYFICINHSERFTSQWNKTHPPRRQYERFFPGDVNVTAHKHKPAFAMDHHYELIREAGVNLGGKHWMVVTGTFKTGPDPYTVRRWSKGVIGVPTVVFHPDYHDTDCFESPSKAVAYMQGLKKSAA